MQKKINLETISAAVLTAVMIVVGVLNIVSYFEAEGETTDENKRTLTIREKISSFHGKYNERFFGQEELVSVYGGIQSYLGRTLIEDKAFTHLARNKDNQITTLPSKKSLNLFKTKILTMDRAAKANGVRTLYVQAPFKIMPGTETGLPKGIKTYANENADGVIEFLKDKGVDTFDLRTELKKSGMSQSELFFKTDHHWTVDAAFYSYFQLTQKLYEDYDFCSKEQMEFHTNPLNYYKFEMKNCFLGTWGRRTGELFVGLDDFNYYVPAYYTNFDFTNVDGDDVLHLKNDFYNTVMTPKYVEKSEEGIRTNRYAAYLGGYTKETRVVNNTLDSDKKLMIVHDSFGFPLSAFMCLTAKETRILDIRNYKDSIKEYIEEYKPDVLLFVFNPDQ